MDRIYIKNLEIFANHGVFPEENRLGQKFVVSAILFTHTREAGKTDDLTKSIHYGEVSRQIKEYMENHTCKLLETVAEGLAEELLLTRPLLEQVQLEIKKPLGSRGSSSGNGIRGDYPGMAYRLHSPGFQYGGQTGLSEYGRRRTGPDKRLRGGSRIRFYCDRPLRRCGTG